MSYSPKFIYDAIKLTAEARLKGEKLPANTIIPSVLITKENAEGVLLPRLAVLIRGSEGKASGIFVLLLADVRWT